jgi:NTP pyrophosphatase (non-canonical NTP hydrolase)
MPKFTWIDESSPVPVDPNPWKPMTNLLDLKHVGKLIEELGECVAAAARCQIQGIDEREPITGKPNWLWLQEELADVFANAELVIEHFELDREAIEARKQKKEAFLRKWHGMLKEI